ncbi:MAG: DUF86 domain-containing protein [Methylobacteriaceae bacterium]|nr:DUF86 domain-containing protein [Methylobacteriaceae bacterium]
MSWRGAICARKSPHAPKRTRFVLSDRARLAAGDIIAHCEHAQAFLREARGDLAADLRSYYAIIHCLEVIPEASRRLPEELKARHPEKPWRAVAAAGNIYRHGYDVVDAQMIIATVEDELPRLAAALRSASN